MQIFIMKTTITYSAVIAFALFAATETQAQKGNTKNNLNFQTSMHTNLKEAPANVLESYATDFPNSLNINWSSEPGVWYVRCDDMNGYKCLTDYKSNGTKVFTARNLKTGEMPAAVASYSAMSGEVSAGIIIQIEVPGELNFWRITSASGRMIFVSNAGAETTNNTAGFATY